MENVDLGNVAMVLCPFDFFSDKITCGECELADRCAAHRAIPNSSDSDVFNSHPKTSGGSNTDVR